MTFVRTAMAIVSAALLAAPGCRMFDSSTDALSADLPIDPPVRNSLGDKQEAKLCLTTARALTADGHDAKAAILYEKARRHDPKLDVSHQLANVYARLDMPERAEAEYEIALKASPGDADLLNDFGCFSLRTDDLTKAEELLRQAIVLRPGHPQATMNLGECLLRSGRHEEGVAQYEKVVGRAAACSNAGVVLAGAGSFDPAKRYLREALQLSPDLTPASALLAELESERPTSVSQVAAVTEAR